MTTASLMARLTLLASVLVSSGCGFQLRGAAPVSPALQPLAIQCSNNVPTELCSAVTDQLRLGGVNLTSPAQADYRLRLTRFEQTRRASAVTLQGSAAEYELRQRVWIDVMTSDSLPLVADSELSSSESYRYDEDQVLAKQREQRDIETTLYQRLAQQVIFRLTPLTEERIRTIKNEAEQATDQSTDTGQ